MSAIRSYIDGIPVWVKADDGASPRPSGRGGGPIEYGALVVGVAPKSNAKAQAEWRAREAEKARERRAAK